MKYLKKTLEYLFVLEKGKRFILLYILSIPAGIAACFVAPSCSLTDWLRSYDVGNTDFWFSWTLSGGGITFGIAFVIFLVLGIFCMSIVTSIVSRSLRVGVFKCDRIMSEFNESFFQSAFSVVAFLFIYLVYKIISTLLLVLWQTIKSVSVSMILSVFALVVCGFALCSVYALMILMPSLMTFNGLKPSDAVITSVRKCGREYWKFMLAICIPSLCVFAIGWGIGVLSIPLLSEIIDGVLYSFLFCYFVTLSMVSYYELEQLPRDDYPREYFFKDKR